MFFIHSCLDGQFEKAFVHVQNKKQSGVCKWNRVRSLWVNLRIMRVGSEVHPKSCIACNTHGTVGSFFWKAFDCRHLVFFQYRQKKFRNCENTINVLKVCNSFSSKIVNNGICTPGTHEANIPICYNYQPRAATVVLELNLYECRFFGGHSPFLLV